MIVLVSNENDVTDGSATALLADVKVEDSKPVSGFSLLDHNGSEITRVLFLGNWTFVFFGYTNCPDVCPATLSQLVRINKLINEQTNLKGRFQTLFVSVDPDRDSANHIKEFVSYFDPGFVGATGEMNNIISFEKQFDAYHIIDDKNQENYSVGHASSVFLVNPDGVYAAKFSPPMDVSVVLQQLNRFVQNYTKG